MVRFPIDMMPWLLINGHFANIIVTFEPTTSEWQDHARPNVSDGPNSIRLQTSTRCLKVHLSIIFKTHLFSDLLGESAYHDLFTFQPMDGSGGTVYQACAERRLAGDLSSCGFDSEFKIVWIGPSNSQVPLFWEDQFGY